MIRQKEMNSVYIKDPSSPGEDVMKRKLSMYKTEEVPDPPDGGYAWVIVFAATSLNLFAFSALTSFGVFMVEWVDYFNSSKTELAWIGSLLMVVIAPISSLMPVLIRRYGCRMVALIGAFGISSSLIITSMAPSVPVLFVSMGFFTGSFSCMLHMSGQVIVQKYFDKKRGLATSLSQMGTALSLFVWPPLSRVLINYFTWRGATLIIAGMVLNSVVCAALLRPPPLKTIVKPIDPRKSQQFEQFEQITTHCGCMACSPQWGRTTLLQYVPHVLMFFGWFFTNCGHSIMIAFTPARADVLGISKNNGALLVSIFGASSGIVRVLAGWIADRPCVTRNMLVGAASLYCGLVTLISLSFKSFPSMAAFSVLYGFGGAFYIGIQGSCVHDVVGIKHISTGFAILFVSMGISYFYSLPLAGFLYDLNNRPFECVIAFAIHQCIGGICLFSIPYVQACIRRRKVAEYSPADIKLDVELQNMNVKS